MPKSKRNKQVDLTKTKKHGLEGKKILYQQIQANVENYAHVFVFSVNDMRNSKMKSVREQWRHSRFCIGKNKVMAKALGLTEEDEFRPNLHKIGQELKGERGLLFTNQPVEEVINWFRSFSEGDYARSGNVATEDVVLPEGPLKQFSHSQESYLRQLGLPTTLQKGVIHLLRDYVVCQVGDRLSPESARILKLLGYEMAEFRIKIQCVWSQDGNFVDLGSETKENIEENKGPFMKDSFKLKYVDDLSNCEIMEVTDNEVLGKRPNKTEASGEEIETSPKEKPDCVAEKTDSKIKKRIDEEISNIKEEKNGEQKITNATKTVEEPMEESDIEEPEVKRFKNQLLQKKPTNEAKLLNKEPTIQADKICDKDAEDQKVLSEEADKAAIARLTMEKLEASEERPNKFSPKLTRARAAAANIKVKTPDSNTYAAIEPRSSRKRKL